jgi:RHS repeat-associated protein
VTGAREQIRYADESNTTWRYLKYEYDGLGQLTSDYAGGYYATDTTLSVAYTYNKAGNIQNEKENGSANPTRVYGYSKVVGGQIIIGDTMTGVGPNSGNLNPLGWDGNGNLTGGTDTQQRNLTLHYTWDSKLRSATAVYYGTDTKTISLKYDPAGNRIYKASSSSLTGNRKYIVDTVGELPVILMEIEPGTTPTIRKTYVYADSEVLAQYNGSQSAPDKYYYLHDRLGSVRQVVAANGEPALSYSYKPFGETDVTATRTNPTPPSNAFMFTGQWYDAEIGQYYLRARQYDPQLYRFTSRDPEKGEFTEPLTLHRYLYCQNEPVNCTDPSGEMMSPAELVIGGIIGGVFGAFNGYASSGGKLDAVAVGMAVGAIAGMFSATMPSATLGTIIGSCASGIINAYGGYRRNGEVTDAIVFGFAGVASGGMSGALGVSKCASSISAMIAGGIMSLCMDEYFGPPIQATSNGIRMLDEHTKYTKKQLELLNGMGIPQNGEEGGN